METQTFTFASSPFVPVAIDFDKGAAKKFVLDPHGMVRSRRAGSELATAGV